MPNIERLAEVVRWVEAEAERPEDERQWRQSEWIREAWCGTQVCVAGKAALLAGWKPVFDAGSNFATTVRRGPAESHVWDAAVEALGLMDDGDANALFSGGNDAADVRRIAEDLAGQPL